jgi:hypothetical protein
LIPWPVPASPAPPLEPLELVEPPLLVPLLLPPLLLEVDPLLVPAPELLDPDAPLLVPPPSSPEVPLLLPLLLVPEPLEVPPDESSPPKPALGVLLHASSIELAMVTIHALVFIRSSGSQSPGLVPSCPSLALRL